MMNPSIDWHQPAFSLALLSTVVSVVSLAYSWIVSRKIDALSKKVSGLPSSN
jgi:hypothetical protein